MIKLNIANKFYLKLKKMKERKIRKESLSWVLAPIFRFATKISPFTSTTFFFFLLLQWRFWESLWSLWMNSTPFLSKIHSALKPKTQQKPKSNRVENEGSHKTETTGEEKGHHGLAVAATMVQPWWTLAGLVCFAPRTTCFAFRLELQVYALDHP